MLSIIRRSQILGLKAIDPARTSSFAKVEEVWLDDRGRVLYLSDGDIYLPLERVSEVEPDIVLVYSTEPVNVRANLHRIDRLAVESSSGETIGWIEDFLFDWQTGEIVAYIVGGEIASPFGELAVLSPEDIETIAAEAIIIKEGATERLKTESEGLKGFLSERSQQVQNLVRTIAERLHHLTAPDDRPEVVRIKIEEVSKELENSGKHELDALKEAKEFIGEQWQSLQQSIDRASRKAKSALDSAWKQLSGKK
jgi:uncharacterized protein YrrD